MPVSYQLGRGVLALPWSSLEAPNPFRHSLQGAGVDSKIWPPLGRSFPHAYAQREDLPKVVQRTITCRGFVHYLLTRISWPPRRSTILHIKGCFYHGTLRFETSEELANSLYRKWYIRSIWILWCISISWWLRNLPFLSLGQRIFVGVRLIGPSSVAQRLFIFRPCRNLIWT